jgi:hypothetical protein
MFDEPVFPDERMRNRIAPVTASSSTPAASLVVWPDRFHPQCPAVQTQGADKAVWGSMSENGRT